MAVLEELTYEEHLANHSKQFDKTQLMEAFQTEQQARKLLNEELNQERKLSAMLKYEKEEYFEKWLRLFIKEDIQSRPYDNSMGDIDEELDKYFNHPNHQTYMTPSGGFYCVAQGENSLFIHYAWANTKKYKQELRDMPELIRRIHDYHKQPVRYCGMINVLKNHSKEISPGLFELTL